MSKIMQFLTTFIWSCPWQNPLRVILQWNVSFSKSRVELWRKNRFKLTVWPSGILCIRLIVFFRKFSQLEFNNFFSFAKERRILSFFGQVVFLIHFDPMFPLKFHYSCVFCNSCSSYRNEPVDFLCKTTASFHICNRLTENIKLR